MKGGELDTRCTENNILLQVLPLVLMRVFFALTRAWKLLNVLGACAALVVRPAVGLLMEIYDSATANSPTLVQHTIKAGKATATGCVSDSQRCLSPAPHPCLPQHRCPKM